MPAWLVLQEATSETQNGKRCVNSCSGGRACGEGESEISFTLHENAEFSKAVFKSSPGPLWEGLAQPLATALYSLGNCLCSPVDVLASHCISVLSLNIEDNDFASNLKRPAVGRVL